MKISLFYEFPLPRPWSDDDEHKLFQDGLGGVEGADEGSRGRRTGCMGETAEAGVVRAFWERLGLPGLVDVHTPFMPERVLHKVWDYFDALGPLTGGVAWPITYREEEAERRTRGIPIADEARAALARIAEAHGERL